MKKVHIFLLGVILMSGCTSNDEMVSAVIKGEIKHLNNYKHIKSTSQDSKTVSYVDSVITESKTNARILENSIEMADGLMFQYYPESQILIKEYIVLCDK